MFGAQDDDLDGLPEPTHAGTRRLEVGVDDHLEHVGFGAPAAVAEDAQEDRGLVLLTLEVDVQGTECLGLGQPLERWLRGRSRSRSRLRRVFTAAIANLEGGHRGPRLSHRTSSGPSRPTSRWWMRRWDTGAVRRS